MLIEYPYEKAQTPGIYWEGDLTTGTPTAIDLNGTMLYFPEESPFDTDDKITIARFVAGQTQYSVAQYFEKRYNVPHIAARYFIEDTFEKAGLPSQDSSLKREQLIARAYRAGFLINEEKPWLRLPRHLQRQYHCLVAALGAGCAREELADMFHIKSSNISDAVWQIADKFGLGHVEEAGPTLVALGAKIIPATYKRTTVLDLYHGLSQEQRFLFRPQTTWKQAVQAANTKTMTVRPSTKDSTAFLRVDSQPKGARKADLSIGKVSHIGFHGAEIEVSSPAIYRPTETTVALSSRSLARLCFMALNINQQNVRHYLGYIDNSRTSPLNRIRQQIAPEQLNEKGKMRDDLSEIRSQILLLRAAFERTNLFTTRKPPQFGTNDTYRDLMLEFGPHILEADYVRDITYGVIAARLSIEQNLVPKAVSVIEARRQLATLRKMFQTKLVGLAFLYLAHRDYYT